MAEKIIALTAICKICGFNASFTHRTCSGQSKELIGGAESYMPLCRECYNEKTKQAKIASQILHSEDHSASTGLNDSGNDVDLLLDMENLNMQNYSAENKITNINKK